VTQIRKDSSQLRTKYRRGGPLQGGGGNHATKIVGGKGKRVSIPRTADSFKSKTDHT
jgi:hypothetical protein